VAESLRGIAIWQGRGVDMAEPAPRTSPVSVRTARVRDQVPITTVHGEIDMYTERLIQNAVSAQLATKPDVLVLDLTDVAFMGSAGLNLLIVNHVQALDQGTRLAVVAGDGFVRRVLAVCGVDDVLDLHQDLESALQRV
jgi:anti-sigma B factor antagonist